jgi:hypothetical protein
MLIASTVLRMGSSVTRQMLKRHCNPHSISALEAIDRFEQHARLGTWLYRTTLRAAFICRDIEGFSTAECAQIIGVSEGALKVRLHRARLALRERVSEYFGEWVASPSSRGDRDHDV